MARWTDLATWRGPTPNQGGAMLEQRGLVIHIAEGYFEGTIAYQLNDASDVSSHFVVSDGAKGQGRDGEIAQIVDTDRTAWTQRAGNGHWLSVECAGFTPNPLTAAQCEAIAQLLVRCHTEYGVPLQIAVNPDGRGLGHHSMGCNWPGGAWGHCDCPGPAIIAQKPAIVARAIEILGDDMTPSQQYIQHVMNYRLDALIHMRPQCNIPAFTATDGSKWPAISETNHLALGVVAADDTGDPPPPPIDFDAISKQIAADVAAQVDVPTAQETAEAVADELHDRTAE